ncbi:hypothetical protein N7540_003885 [Penicillium herquei]|nr:hypothetical protein N7540_003885 [Penicillium herquei]
MSTSNGDDPDGWGAWLLRSEADRTQADFLPTQFRKIDWQELSSALARWMWYNISAELKARIKLTAGPIRRGYADTLYDAMVEEMEHVDTLTAFVKIKKCHNMTGSDFSLLSEYVVSFMKEILILRSWKMELPPYMVILIILQNLSEMRKRKWLETMDRERDTATSFTYAKLIEYTRRIRMELIYDEEILATRQAKGKNR